MLKLDASTASLLKFLEERDLGLYSAGMARELRYIAGEILLLAKSYLEESNRLLDEAGREAVRYAHYREEEREAEQIEQAAAYERAAECWPDGLEAEIRKALEERDELARKMGT